MVHSIHTRVRRGSRILPNNRAIVLRQGGQCRRVGGRNGWLIRAQQLRRKTISCEGQVTRRVSGCCGGPPPPRHRGLFPPLGIQSVVWVVNIVFPKIDETTIGGNYVHNPHNRLNTEGGGSYRSLGKLGSQPTRWTEYRGG